MTDMKHTPFGYNIVNGAAVINEEQAEVIRKLATGYLSGATFANLARENDVGITAVKRILADRRYIGNGYYPQILAEKMMDEIAAERKKRLEAQGRSNVKKRIREKPKPQTEFQMKPVRQIYKDPVKQAEYAYEQIKGRVI
ncbi:MAG: recombinase [Galactobacillus timonensis]|nr:recombinase [Galactobacillus timonensis]